MSFSFFVLGVIVFPNLVWWAWADRRLRGRTRARLAFTLFMAPVVAMVVWIALFPDTARRSHTWLPELWTVFWYPWHLLVLPAVIVIYPTVGLLRRLLRRPPMDPSRRGFLAACAVWAPPAATGVAFVASLPDLHDFRVKKMTVPVPGLPPALDGMTIAHVSDLHYGKYTRTETMDRLVAEVNALQADLVLLTGDLIDLSLVDLPAAVDVVNRFDRRGGLFMCEGNHDLIDNGTEFARGVKEAGIPLLRDEAVTVRVRGETVRLVGARWQSDGWRGLADGFSILLAHHPHLFDDADGFPLTLAGHTHGGQLMLTERLGAGPVMFRYWSGLYTRPDRSLVVSNGVGNWFPLRTRAPAEVLHLVLRAAN